MRVVVPAEGCSGAAPSAAHLRALPTRRRDLSGGWNGGHSASRTLFSETKRDSEPRTRRGGVSGS